VFQVDPDGVLPTTAPLWASPTPADGAQMTATATLPMTLALAASPSVPGTHAYVRARQLPYGGRIATNVGNHSTATFSWAPPYAGDFTASFVTADSYVPATTSSPRTFTFHVTKRGSALAAKPEILGTSALTVHLRMKATLTATKPSQPLANGLVKFTTPSGTALCQAYSDFNGVAACGTVLTYARTILNRGYLATFAGDAAHTGSSATGVLIQ
jgi:hypothetical protein